jgi:hypothetical protein
LTVTNAALAAMDARLMTTFAHIGLADANAIYTPNGSTPGTVPNCTVMIDRAVQVLGDIGEVIGHRDVATFMRSDVAPAAGGTLKIGTETRTLEKKTSEDESLSEWVLNG